MFNYRRPETQSVTRVATSLESKDRAPHLAAIFLAAVFAVSFFHGQTVRADVPVYLNLESRYPSGVHPREWLEARTKETQVQRWFRVVVDGAYGWLPEDHLLTEMKLTSIARMLHDEPDRSQPLMDSLRSRRIPKGTQVIILETVGSWSRGRVLGEDAPNQDSWILNEALRRDTGMQIERGVTFREASLHLSPSKKIKPIDRFAAYKEVSVLNSISNSGGDWLEVQIDNGTAWLERGNVWLPRDLKNGSVRALHTGLELRSSPLPQADIVRRLAGTEVLNIVNSKYLRWGKVKVPEHGWLWWPISDDRLDGPNAIPPLKLSTQDLIGRNIYDMAASESVPGLRFASAKGVFKSRDGIEWSMIPKFENQNYPIVVAKTGSLFVGPYVSTDHGENFEQWIRWDRLVEALKRQTGLPPSRMRISKLQTLDADGNSIELTLDFGRSKPVQIETRDRGLNWKLR
jgi:SH3-like domain-containing protein